MHPKQYDRKYTDRNDNMLISSDEDETSRIPLHPKFAQPSAQNQDFELFKSCNPSPDSTTMVKDTAPLKHIPPIGRRDVQPLFAISNPRLDTVKDPRFTEGGQPVPSKQNKEPPLDIDDIPWSDLVLKERIGAGIFLTSRLDNLFLISRFRQA
jgi:serine/threonine-protein kinase CTR1